MISDDGPPLPPSMPPRPDLNSPVMVPCTVVPFFNSIETVSFESFIKNLLVVLVSSAGCPPLVRCDDLAREGPHLTSFILAGSFDVGFLVSGGDV